MKNLGPQGAGELLSVVGDAVQVALSQGTPSWANSPLPRPWGTDNSLWSLPRTSRGTLEHFSGLATGPPTALDVPSFAALVKCHGLLPGHEGLQPGQLDSLSCKQDVVMDQ